VGGFLSIKVTTKALWKSLIVGLLAGWFSANKPTIKPTNGLVVTNKINEDKNGKKTISTRFL
jgi:hypothetical protein